MTPAEAFALDPLVGVQWLLAAWVAGVVMGVLSVVLTVWYRR